MWTCRVTGKTCSWLGTRCLRKLSPNPHSALRPDRLLTTQLFQALPRSLVEVSAIRAHNAGVLAKAVTSKLVSRMGAC